MDDVNACFEGNIADKSGDSHSEPSVCTNNTKVQTKFNHGDRHIDLYYNLLCIVTLEIERVEQAHSVTVELAS